MWNEIKNQKGTVRTVNIRHVVDNLVNLVRGLSLGILKEILMDLSEWVSFESFTSKRKLGS